MFQIKTQRNTGFSLVEMIVAIGVFAIVITIALGALIGIMDANRKIQATRTAMDNVNNVLDQMVREIGAGKLYHCGDESDYEPNDPLLDCENTESKALTFTTQVDNSVTYLFEDGAVLRRKNGGGYEKLTGDDIVIEKLGFRVFGNENEDIQPKAFVTIQGEVLVGRSTPSGFNIQTTIVEQPQRAATLAIRPSNLSICPFSDTDGVNGRIVVDFTDVKDYFLNDGATQECVAVDGDTGACKDIIFDLSDPRFLGGTISAGTYTVRVSSFDDNFTYYSPGEIFFIELQNAVGGKIIETAYTEDTERIAPLSPTGKAPDNIIRERKETADSVGQCYSDGRCLRFNKPATIVLEDTFIEEVFFIKAAGGNEINNSVVPLCVAFDPQVTENIEFDEF